MRSLSFPMLQAFLADTLPHLDSVVAEAVDAGVGLESMVREVQKNGSGRLSSYQRWIIQLYAPDLMARFGGLNVVEEGLLPARLLSMFRESRLKWQG